MCQPGRPGPHGLSHAGSPGFEPFHNAKSAGLCLPSRVSARAGQHLGQIATAELAVVGVLRAFIIDVAVERVRVTLLDQPGDDLLHLLDVLRRVGHVVDAIHAERPQVVEIILGHLPSQRLDSRPQLVGLHDELVIHIGDVDDPRHLIPGVRQIPLDRVEDHRPDHVPNVSRLVNRRPAQIHRDLPGSTV